MPSLTQSRVSLSLCGAFTALSFGLCAHAQIASGTEKQIEAWLRDQLDRSLTPFAGWGPCEIRWIGEMRRPEPDHARMRALREEVADHPDHPKRSELDLLESYDKEQIVTEEMSLIFGNGGLKDRWRFASHSNRGDRVVARDGDVGWFMTGGAITMVSMSRAGSNESPLAYETTAKQFMLDLQFGGIRSATNPQSTSAVSVKMLDAERWTAVILWPSGLSTSLQGIGPNELGAFAITERRFPQPTGNLTTRFSSTRLDTPQGTHVADQYSCADPGGFVSTMKILSIEAMDESAVIVAVKPEGKEMLVASQITHIHDRRATIAKWTDLDKSGNVISTGQSSGGLEGASPLTRSGWIVLGVVCLSLVAGLVLRLKLVCRTAIF